VKRPQEFTVGFADRTRVTAMKGFGGKIEATYRVHSREPRPHVRIVEARAIGDPKSQGKAELRERELGLMSREEIRGWIDGEGHIECKPKKRFGSQIIITQKSREPLEVLALSLKELGVKCTISRRNNSTRCHIAVVCDVKGVARVIREVGPFRTPQRREQVRQFVDYLMMERKQRRRSVERAKRILGL
ncbi:MAG: hypothetical protein E6K84_03000, partial [Thaumarchaeota archaeon]